MQNTENYTFDQQMLRAISCSAWGQRMLKSLEEWGRKTHIIPEEWKAALSGGTVTGTEEIQSHIFRTFALGVSKQIFKQNLHTYKQLFLSICSFPVVSPLPILSYSLPESPFLRLSSPHVLPLTGGQKCSGAALFPPRTLLPLACSGGGESTRRRSPPRASPPGRAGLPGQSPPGSTASPPSPRARLPAGHAAGNAQRPHRLREGLFFLMRPLGPLHWAPRPGLEELTPETEGKAGREWRRAWTHHPPSGGQSNREQLLVTALSLRWPKERFSSTSRWAPEWAHPASSHRQLLCHFCFNSEAWAGHVVAAEEQHILPDKGQSSTAAAQCKMKCSH